jgi:hypothetical protein
LTSRLGTWRVRSFWPPGPSGSRRCRAVSEVNPQVGDVAAAKDLCRDDPPFVRVDRVEDEQVDARMDPLPRPEQVAVTLPCSGRGLDLHAQTMVDHQVNRVDAGHGRGPRDAMATTQQLSHRPEHTDLRNHIGLHVPPPLASLTRRVATQPVRVSKCSRITVVDATTNISNEGDNCGVVQARQFEHHE